MNKFNLKIWLPAAGIFLILVLVWFLRAENGHDSDAGPVKFKEIEVARGDFRIIVTANGAVSPINRIEIKSKASGIVEELPVEQGDHIRAGQLIARLDQKDELAAVGEAQANYDVARAELKQAEKAYERRSNLFEQNLISEEERDQIELNLAIAKGKLIQARTVLDRSNERLAESIVRAPVDGIILQKYVEVGQIIASGVSNVSGGTPIVDLADMSRVYIQAGIDEIDVGKVRENQAVTVVADAYPNQKFYGRIVRIAPEARVDQNVTLFDVIVEVENPDGLLKSGMNTTIEITVIEKKDVLLVPALALQTTESGNGFEVMIKTDRGFKFSPVEVGERNFRNAEILAGLNEGDMIGIPMVSRLKEQNDEREDRIRRSQSFGGTR